MKLALLSDIHGNLRALQACLAHADACGAGRIAVLGDLVGYGAEPGAVVDWAADVLRRDGIVLQGNHDEAAAREPATATGGREVTSEDASTAWTRAQLSAAQREFLASLPLEAVAGEVLLVHASPQAPGQWIYLDRPERALLGLQAAQERHGLDRVLAGHVHEQRLYYRGRGAGLLPFEPTPGVAIPLRPHRTWAGTIGSVGQPRDGDVRAAYALLDTEENRLAFHRVPYDHLAAAAAIRATSLPVAFAQRLEQGR